MTATLYSKTAQTARIAGSPFILSESVRMHEGFRQGFQTMPNNGAAALTATERKMYRIGELSRLADVKPFVLRYWESEFPMLEPVKTSSGQRLYSQEDVDLVFRIKRLLYDEGFTIAGARRFLREHNGMPEPEPAAASHAPESKGQLLNRKMLLDLRDSLRAFLTLLERR